MSVRQSLLAILDQGSCYGYQLRTEYERRTGAPTLNVGQIYTTLERLERDGLVVREGAGERGSVYWAITETGRASVAEWFGAPEARGGRDDLVHKVTLAATLPGVDAVALAEAQRTEARRRVDELAPRLAHADDTRGRILAAAAHARAVADVLWLDAAIAALSADPSPGPYGLSEERPRRGRPARELAG